MKHDTSKVKEESQTHSLLVPLLSAVAVMIIVLVVGFFAFDYFFKNRTFSHERLHENDFNNPIYQERDAEPFRLDPDKVSFILIQYNKVFKPLVLRSSNIVILGMHSNLKIKNPLE